MIKIYEAGAYVIDGKEIIPDGKAASEPLLPDKAEARKNTIAYGIMEKHNTSGNMDSLKIKFDAMASHDITYVGIIQTAKASGLEKFPIPYVLTNCHNSLCAVGGTINEDDHIFGLSAAQKYGGIYVPAHQAVIHQYMREEMSGCGKMILGSDSHTRYGALGTMAIGEGGGELAKQLLNKTYDINLPQVVGVFLTGKPEKGVGPQDVALAIIGAVFEKGTVKNKVMEFLGDGIGNLNVEYRNGIDVMTTETTCLSSIWKTDSQVEEYYEAHGRKQDYREMKPGHAAYYDGFIEVDLSAIKPMIAMPFHPSNVFEIEELKANAGDILDMLEKNADGEMKLNFKDKLRDGKLYVDQGVIAGCAGGTFDNITDATDILRNGSIGSSAFALSVYPSSQPTFLSLVENGAVASLLAAGATVRSAFCGPCFGAGEVPGNNCLSVRHTTRNFPNREGSKPSAGQIAAVALMDARSIAATALNKGELTAATEIDVEYTKPKYYFKKEVYENRVFNGYGKACVETPLVMAPSIRDWPTMPTLTENLLLRVASVIHDPVTTTDELIPSGETSSYRSNPHALAEFTLSRKDPDYVARAKEIYKLEQIREDGGDPYADAQLQKALDGAPARDFSNAIGILKERFDISSQNTGIGSIIYANRPGDGSAREQAASCQRVLGGWANLAREYATKRYRSNLINWGMLPFVCTNDPEFQVGDFIFIPGVLQAVKENTPEIKAYAVRDGITEISVSLGELTDDERKIIAAGCLINFYKI